MNTSVRIVTIFALLLTACAGQAEKPPGLPESLDAKVLDRGGDGRIQYWIGCVESDKKGAGAGISNLTDEDMWVTVTFRSAFAGEPNTTTQKIGPGESHVFTCYFTQRIGKVAFPIVTTVYDKPDAVAATAKYEWEFDSGVDQRAARYESGMDEAIMMNIGVMFPYLVVIGVVALIVKAF